MKNCYLFLSAVIFFSACASNQIRMPSMSEQWDLGHFYADPQSNTMVVIGVASRHEWREHEIAAAKEEAAQKIALFYGIRITSEFYQRIGTTFEEFTLTSCTIIDHIVDYTQFISRLTFDPERDVLIHDLGSIVRFRYATRVTPVNFIGTRDANGRPNWIQSRNLPRVDGYMVAVGYSRNQEWLRETVLLSAANAATRLMQHIFADGKFVIDSEIDTVETIDLRSEGILSNFRVLEFWIEPTRGDVYTLGIAKINY